MDKNDLKLDPKYGIPDTWFDVLGGPENVENLWQDYLRIYDLDSHKNVFSVFCMGAINLMNPKADFNSHYKLPAYPLSDKPIEKKE